MLICMYRKVLINARAFIRIITFHEEGDGHLLEASSSYKLHDVNNQKSLCFVFYD